MMVIYVCNWWSPCHCSFLCFGIGLGLLTCELPTITAVLNRWDYLFYEIAFTYSSDGIEHIFLDFNFKGIEGLLLRFFFSLIFFVLIVNKNFRLIFFTLIITCPKIPNFRNYIRA